MPLARTVSGYSVTISTVKGGYRFQIEMLKNITLATNSIYMHY
ncbi:hypothetical protein PRABACTJOHN_02194 [Parabacteroides johnsonii DSM 18315]|uniref:Uncharacterized protein n=1 Tax=Parabacteroides johnsonii DSM 18315 TaxID=537006 RepID=B7BAY5_9BACT|nr:hypothetical protein PRABACTJOHN_02194 [Parabacteroides johnsonii DSM 18315]